MPVFVLSNTLTKIPESHKEKAHLVQGVLVEILDQIHQKGFDRIYIDGGTTIRGFLEEDLIDSMVITTIPVLLGGGSPLFSDLQKKLEFECTETRLF